MFSTRKILALFILLAVILTACAPAATAVPATSAPVAPAATSAPVATEAPATVAPTEAPAPIALTFLVGSNENDQLMNHALIDAYMKLHPNVTITIENGPTGADADNLVKTRLATGEMNDLFYYNSGSLLQALHPTETLVDLSQQPFMANIVDSFKQTVSQNGQIFGVPVGTASAGGILYNKKVFTQVGISAPKTWAEFESNNEKLKAAGIAPIIATFGDTWTSQLLILADYYNVQLANPTFAADYTANKAKYATAPGAMAGFSYLEEGFKKGWWQQDYATTKFDQGLKLLSDGKGAQYPMLSFALGTIATNSPEVGNDIGFFAIPGADAAKTGATIWMPLAIYIPKTSQHISEAEDFLAFVASTAGTDAITSKVAPSGPYVIKGAKLPDNVLPGVKDIAAYIDAGTSAPALEFLSPIKGPSLEQFCVAVGTGQMDAATAAANYDEDVKKQAQQLGLPGWDN